MFTVAKYGRRYWAVLAPTGELVCVTLYRKGAEEVVRRLAGQERGSIGRNVVQSLQ